MAVLPALRRARCARGIRRRPSWRVRTRTRRRASRPAPAGRRAGRAPRRAVAPASRRRWPCCPHFDGRGVPEEFDGVLLGEFVLVLVGGHPALPPPVDEQDALRAEPSRLRHGVDGRVARTSTGAVCQRNSTASFLASSYSYS